MALKKYLNDHTDHFIDDVGRNSWVSLFEEKLLPEVSEILELLIINHKNISNYFIFLVDAEVNETTSRLIFAL